MTINPLFPYPNIHTHKAKNSQEVQNCFPEDSYEQGVFSVGIHPCYIIEDGQAQWKKVVKRASTPLPMQIAIFEQHITLAEELHKPLIIHCVKSYGELIGLRKKSGATGLWILHGFHKSEALAHELLHAGIKLSFNITLLHDPRLKHLTETLPRADFFFETDEDNDE